jgi:hypothetical protein
MINMINLDKFRLGKISNSIGEDSVYYYGVCSKCDFIYESMVDFHFSDCRKCGSRGYQRSLTEYQFLEFLGDLRIKKINSILENG